ncbi:GNAT family N-acetyltransferase [bacterium]|nr:GNAT family N-acetyltransferase [bacterium]
MSTIKTYTTSKLTEKYYKTFAGVYNDFKMRAQKDYKFELAPLDYEDFIDAIEKNLIECIILLEDDIPTGLLIYTTMISESLELNLIHCLGNDNITAKRQVLLDKFIEINKELMKEKITTYPMLGVQNDFAKEIILYDFKLTGIVVLRFFFNLPNCTQILAKLPLISEQLPYDYSIVSWDSYYHLTDSYNIIFEAFQNSFDALFDPRFKTQKGVKDIINKITKNIYGDFIPQATKILLHRNKPVGICFVNITGGTIANIPLIGIKKEHQHKGLGKILLQSAVDELKHLIGQKSIHLTEINVSTDTENHSAVKMYRHVGFKEDYCYTQAYTET